MKKIAIILLLLLATFACKKTVEGETEDWQANKTRLKKLKASYPSFTNVLDKELQDAETKWKEAKNISKEADKIKIINTFLKGITIKDLSLQFRYKEFAIRELLVKNNIEIIEGIKIIPTKWQFRRR